MLRASALRADVLPDSAVEPRLMVFDPRYLVVPAAKSKTPWALIAAGIVVVAGGAYLVLKK